MVHGRPSFGPLDSPITGTPSGAFQSWGYSEPDVGNAFHRIWTVPIVKSFVIGFQVTALDAVELPRQTSCHRKEILTDHGTSVCSSAPVQFRRPEVGLEVWPRPGHQVALLACKAAKPRRFLLNQVCPVRDGDSNQAPPYRRPHSIWFNEAPRSDANRRRTC